MLFAVVIPKYNVLYVTDADDMLQAVSRAVSHVPARKREILTVVVNGHEYTHRIW